MLRDWPLFLMMFVFLSAIVYIIAISWKQNRDEQKAKLGNQTKPKK